MCLLFAKVTSFLNIYAAHEKIGGVPVTPSLWILSASPAWLEPKSSVCSHGCSKGRVRERKHGRHQRDTRSPCLLRPAKRAAMDFLFAVTATHGCALICKELICNLLKRFVILPKRNSRSTFAATARRRRADPLHFCTIWFVFFF